MCSFRFVVLIYVMDIINKIKSTVTTVVSGIPLSGDFEILGHKGSGGPGLSWKIYDGIKRTTKQVRWYLI